MKVSQLNASIIIEEKHIEIDLIGNHTAKWHIFYTAYCSVDTRSPQEKDGVVNIQDNSRYTFTMRYCAKLKDANNTQYRIVFKNEIYNILGIDFMNFKNKWIKIFAQKVART